MVLRLPHLPVFSLLLTIVACDARSSSSRERGAEPPAPRSSSFALTRDDLRSRGAKPELVDKLASSPYAYFRFIAEPFAQRVCELFRDKRWEIPAGVVHGDAHLEQFVVTDETYGLEDFDQTGFGSPVVDLVRFATSIHLACREVSWACDPEQAVSVFLEAYKEGVTNPRLATDTPPVVERLRAENAKRPDFLEWAESLMVPLTSEQEKAVRENWQAFVSFFTEVQPQEPELFEVVEMGELKIGIGSALDRKLLFRVRGPTEDPADDLILEAKLQSMPEGVECVGTPPAGGMFRPLMAAARIGRRVPDVFGYVPLEQRPDRPVHFWVQQWDPGYTELSIADLQDQAELDQIVHDAGLQLGTGASSLVPEVLLAQHRYACLRAFDMLDARVRESARSLADEVVQQWSQLRRD